ncbi:hypothetical protein EVJ58_g5915 [Rhodofomes roseus]|uniref:F-box domain-containing protein n=1 Tax=Rhodofomes roseus TaxID=34475 RepID=A0A4Y9Y9N8_9APHY|nr:hypothetical protein EVJ58_g5915 [Rhodofomes roseus]
MTRSGDSPTSIARVLREYCVVRQLNRRPTGINDLPHDVLVLILRDAFSKTRRFFSRTRIYGQENTTEWASRPPYDDRNPEHASAECLASVCPLWREAMSGLSVFWTQLIIWVGTDPTPLSRIRQYLSWSRDHLLEVYVLRRFDPFMEDRAEKGQIKAIFELLLPHVARWKILCMALLHASSLPIPCIDLVGRADNLAELRLDFLVDDAVESIDNLSPPTSNFDTAELETLSMSAVHFREWHVRSFPQRSLPPRLWWLSLTGYASNQAPWTVAELLNTLLTAKQLCVLYLNNVQLDCSHPDPPLARPKRYGWQVDVTFTDMSAEVIAEYNRLLSDPYVEAVSYIRCSIPNGDSLSLRPVNSSYNVTLDQIADPLATLYFLTVVAGPFSYAIAHIYDCDGLCPETLSALATTTRTDDGEVFSCFDLRELHIGGCKRFQSSDLRAMLEARYKAHEATGFATEDDEGYVVTSVRELHVHDCCELDPKDKEWLNKHLESVYWDDWKGGTGPLPF